MRNFVYLFVLISVVIDDGAEFDCSDVLQSHSQDVKSVCWHPSKEVQQWLCLFILAAISKFILIDAGFVKL